MRLPQASLPSWIWIPIVALSLVSHHYFADGLSGDAPVYAFISQQMLASQDYFRMSSALPEFQPFAEHPHPAFWLQALLFQVFGADDWSFRLLGHLFLIGSLFALHKILQNSFSSDESVRRADLSLVFLAAWPLFAKFYDNSYLDAGMIFLLLLAVLFNQQSLLQKVHWKRKCFSAGVFLGGAIVYKGFVALAAIPAIVLPVFLRQHSSRDGFFFVLQHWSFIFLGATILPLSYFFVLSASDYSEFLQIYMDSVSRRSEGLDLSRAFEWAPVASLLKETHALILFIPVFLFFHMKQKNTAVLKDLLTPALWLGAFYMGYVSTGRSGFQYWTTLMPALAWMLVMSFPKNWLPQSRRLRWITFFVSCAVIVIGQLVPGELRSKADPISQELLQLQQASTQSQKVTALFMAKGYKIKEDFSDTGRILWYGALEKARYVEGEIPEARFNAALVAAEQFWAPGQLSKSKELLQKKGWCLQLETPSRSLWLAESRGCDKRL